MLARSSRNNRAMKYTDRIESRWPFERGVTRFANRPPCPMTEIIVPEIRGLQPFPLDNQPPAWYVATESTNEEPPTGVHNI